MYGVLFKWYKFGLSLFHSLFQFDTDFSLFSLTYVIKKSYNFTYFS